MRMGILSSFFSRVFTRALRITSGDDYIWGPGGFASASGEAVNKDTAMRITAVYACVKLISETLATLPLVLYREKGEGRERAKEHALYKLLHDAPNYYQDICQFIETMQMHVLLRGNAYAEVGRDDGGQVVELVILNPDLVLPVLVGGTVRYEVLRGGQTEVLNVDKILHIRGPSSDGLVGLSPIDLARETLGAAQALDKHSGGMWKNGARMGGVLTHPGKLTPAGLQNLRSSWDGQTAGAGNSGKTAILENGMKYEPIAMTSEQAQFIEQKKMSRTEIASIFHVPPHMIGDLERATFSNIEQQSLEFVTYTMRPWFVRWERAIKNRLLTVAEQKKFKAEFNADALLRGDFLSRQQGLAIQRQNGIINIDEWRALENRNPLPNNDGKDHLVPMNMQPAGEEPKAAPSPGDGVPNTPGNQSSEPNDGTKPPSRALRSFVERELRHFLRKEHVKTSKERAKNSNFDMNLYLENWKEEMRSDLLPVFALLRELYNEDESAENMARRYVEGYGKRAIETDLGSEAWETGRLPTEMDAFFAEVGHEKN